VDRAAQSGLMRKLALVVEMVAILAVFASFFAGNARWLALGGGVALFAIAAGLGAMGRRREMPSFWLWFASLAVYAFLYIPLAIVVIFSFNDSKLNAEWVGFTTAWYGKLLENESMLQAAGNSLLIALVSAAIATLLGTMAGIAIHRYRSKLLPVLVFTPVAMPEILLGVSLLVFFLNSAKPLLARVGIDFDLGVTTVIIAHITFSIGFVAIIVRARLAGMDESIFEAARDLGATPWQTFRLVTLPLVLPGIIAGALMAFTLSIDDFVITFFTSGVGTKTLPLEIYTMIKVAVTPEVNAVSTLLMALTLAMIVVAGRVAPDALRANS
jgi:spermidine/putrescine transport system permease protein